MEENSASISKLIASLEEATQMAKQMQITSNPSHLRQIYSSLQLTNTHISSFLNSHCPPPSTTVAAGENLQPMDVGEDEEVEEAEQNPTIERVEERLKDCFIGNKRKKRPLSPANTGEQRVYECNGGLEFDPYATKTRALDLIYQFHS